MLKDDASLSTKDDASFIPGDSTTGHTGARTQNGTKQNEEINKQKEEKEEEGDDDDQHEEELDDELDDEEEEDLIETAVDEAEEDQQNELRDNLPASGQDGIGNEEEDEMFHTDFGAVMTYRLIKGDRFEFDENTGVAYSQRTIQQQRAHLQVCVLLLTITCLSFVY
jgi:hypothetical protein